MEDIPNIEKNPETYTAEIIKNHLDTEPDSISPLGMSIGGFVMKVETGKGVFVVKMVANEKPADLTEEDVGERVYGGRWIEFEPALHAMQAANLPLPDIHATGYTDDGSKYFILMDYVEGESVREFMTEADDDKNLHLAIGSTFGNLHNITRDYQGWVSMDSPYETSWGEAFFSALQSQIDQIEENSYLPADTIAKLRSFVESRKDTWIEPSEFVLSHLDGFQGIAAKQSDDWSVDSIVDIEDHQFTDQRFVLCGHELAMETEGKKLPDSFWEGYRYRKEVDPTFEQHKSLFKLYYLSVWLCVFKDESIGEIPDRDEKAENTIRMIQSLLES